MTHRASEKCSKAASPPSVFRIYKRSAKPASLLRKQSDTDGESSQPPLVAGSITRVVPMSVSIGGIPTTLADHHVGVKGETSFEIDMKDSKFICGASA